MRYLGPALAASLAVCALCTGIWLFEAWKIAGYQSELRDQLRHAAPTLPEETARGLEAEVGGIMRLFEPRIQQAERIKFWALVCGAAALAAACAVQHFRNTLVFLITITGGVMQIGTGKLPGRFAEEAGDVIRKSNITRATIWARRTGQFVRLGFSGEVPSFLRQRSRNLWADATVGAGSPGRIR